MSSALMSVWGLIVTSVLLFAGGPLFRVFVPGNEAVVRAGVDYLRILAISQLFQCLEGIAAGAFRGMGRTIPPFITSATSNLLRLVAAVFLSRGPMGLHGIYWAVPSARLCAGRGSTCGTCAMPARCPGKTARLQRFYNGIYNKERFPANLPGSVPYFG